MENIEALVESQIQTMLAAAELAFRCAEKGMNLQATLAKIEAMARETAQPKQPRFLNVGCSHCGGAFGPGDAGFSHCVDHAGLQRNERPLG